MVIQFKRRKGCEGSGGRKKDDGRLNLRIRAITEE